MKATLDDGLSLDEKLHLPEKHIRDVDLVRMIVSGSGIGLNLGTGVLDPL